MAKLRFEIPDSLQKQLAKCAEIDKIAPKMIGAAMPVAVNAIKSSLETHKQSGSLIESVTGYKAKAAKYGGYYGAIKFKGYSEHTYKGKVTQDKVPNAQKAMSLEYGSSKQNAEPFLDNALKGVEKEVIEKMQEVFNKEVEND